VTLRKFAVRIWSTICPGDACFLRAGPRTSRRVPTGELEAIERVRGSWTPPVFLATESLAVNSLGLVVVAFRPSPEQPAAKSPAP
jgi:hypothetical protein